MQLIASHQFQSTYDVSRESLKSLHKNAFH